MRSPKLIVWTLLLAAIPVVGAAAPSVPFDEQTLDRIDALNQAITRHYEKLQDTASEIEAKRARIKDKMKDVQTELKSIEEERAELPPSEIAENGPGLRVIEEHRTEAKARYLETLAEKHAIDVEATRSFETHGSAILKNLERLASALEESGRLDGDTDDAVTLKSFKSLQQGTAIALSVLEEWGAMTRDDPRFRALWATARVLSRNVRRMQASEGIRLTVDLVRERTFVVRSLIDQARALRASLDHQGLLLQVAAQNQMLRLHFNRLGAINGLELPDLDIEDTTRRILEDIEEEPFVVSSSESEDGLGGFEECLHFGTCN
jgi:hypothetical protein